MNGNVGLIQNHDIVFSRLNNLFDFIQTLSGKFDIFFCRLVDNKTIPTILADRDFRQTFPDGFDFAVFHPLCELSNKHV